MPAVTQSSLPDSLAKRLQFLRTAMDMTPKQLAEKANIELETIEDIESGLVLFLSTTTRQKISRALRVRSQILKDVEQVFIENTQEVTMEVKAALIETIQTQGEKTHYCPCCGSELHIRCFERRDLEDQPITVIKINCSKCLFRVEH